MSLRSFFIFPSTFLSCLSVSSTFLFLYSFPFCLYSYACSYLPIHLPLLLNCFSFSSLFFSASLFPSFLSTYLHMFSSSSSYPSPFSFSLLSIFLKHPTSPTYLLPTSQPAYLPLLSTSLIYSPSSLSPPPSLFSLFSIFLPSFVLKFLSTCLSAYYLSLVRTVGPSHLPTFQLSFNPPPPFHL